MCFPEEEQRVDTASQFPMRKSLTENRIIKRKTDIDRIFKAGKRSSLSCFKVLAVDNNLSYSRIIVIPVRKFGNSVQRNHIRRQVKEIWRTNLEKIPSGFDYAVVAYPDSRLTYRDKEEALLELFIKVPVRS